MNWAEYLAFMSDQYFTICKDKTVLEIGPNDGVHTKLIVNHSPKYLELIEPFADATDNLKSIDKVSNVIVDDVPL